jgi:hypothetical protein
MCACRCGIKPRSPGQSRRALRQGIGGDHERAVAGPASRAIEEDRAARLRRAGIASRLPLGFQGGFPRGPLSEFRIARLLHVVEPVRHLRVRA